MTDAEVDEMDAALKTFIAQTVQKTGLQVELKQVSQYPAAPFHPDCKQVTSGANVLLHAMLEKAGVVSRS